MSRGSLIILLVSAHFLIGGAVQSLPSLPAGATANAVQVNTAADIYVAGNFVQSGSSLPHAFVAKLSPDGSQVIWWTVLAGSNQDAAVALALGPDDSIYVTGTTYSSDFPTTPGAVQPATSVSNQAFAAKINPAGGVVYATYIGGTDTTTGRAIAVDASGDAFITGGLESGGVFPVTPGAAAGAIGASYETGYIVELNPAGTAAVVAIQGFGGNAIALDGQGNIYAAGAFAGPAIVPTTSGAFQTTESNQTCGTAGLLGSFPCTYQHLAKIDPTGTKLIYSTYLSGRLGATPASIAVDANGNAIVAGTTHSPDYPTTPGAYQPEYFGNPDGGQVALDIWGSSGCGVHHQAEFIGHGPAVVHIFRRFRRCAIRKRSGRRFHPGHGDRFRWKHRVHWHRLFERSAWTLDDTSRIAASHTIIH